jgi:hypothetical protein
MNYKQAELLARAIERDLKFVRADQDVYLVDNNGNAIYYQAARARGARHYWTVVSSDGNVATFSIDDYDGVGAILRKAA